MYAERVRLTAAVVLLCMTSAWAGAETWYALSESMDVRPYGYLRYSGEVPAIFKGAKSRKAVMRQVYSVETLGRRMDGENYKEFQMELQGGLMAFIARQKSGESTVISEGEFRRDGLYVQQYAEGSPPEASPRRTTPPGDVLFATSPSFLWPIVKNADKPVTFRLYDIMTFSLKPTVAKPAGMQVVTIGTKTWNTRKFMMETLAPGGGAREGATRMMAQYLEIKRAHPDCLLFYRMGDFYELFFDDAVKAAKALDITLTRRGKHDGRDVPMCGVPVHAAEGYLARLIRRGFRVAVAEQTEEIGRAHV